MILAMFLQMAARQPDATQTTLLFFGCALFTAALLFYTFMPSEVESAEEKTRLAFLYERKEQIYENLRDLNFEYKAGKLSDDDFNTMRDSMEQDAAALLAEIDQIEKAAQGRRIFPRESSQKGGRP